LNPISFTLPEEVPGGVTSPSSKTSQKTPDKGISSGIQDTTPFNMEVWVESPDTARSAGLDADRIKDNTIEGNDWTGIRNVIHLVVVDENGKVADFQEVLKESDNQEGAALVVTRLTYGSTYKFLMLMGHKERDYAAQGYEYQDNPPTLLAAGYTRQSISRGQKITITLYPVVVETTFTSPMEQAVDAVLWENPLEADAEWEIAWEVTGLQALEAAALEPGDIFAGAGTIVQGEDIAPKEGTPTPAVNELNIMQISQDVSGYTAAARAGKQNSAGFNVEYVPFNLPQAGWNGWTASPPVWIIRNGINDLPQNEYTSFERVNWGAGLTDPNGNGAVNFTALATSLYVNGDIGNDSSGNGSITAPFATLAHAYQAALDKQVQTIVVLSDLDGADGTMTLDPAGVPVNDFITITSDTVQQTLKRPPGDTNYNDSVVKVTGGAKVVFSNITINGSINNPSNPLMWNRALFIEDADVTLEAGAQLFGKIDKDAIDGGGGVYLKSGTFTMNADSTIDGHAMTNRVNYAAFSCNVLSGGGVFVNGGIFTMNAGSKITGNAAPSNNYYLLTNIKDISAYNPSGVFAGGGGVFVGGGEFIMNGGTVEGKAVSGGGVYVNSGGKFTMHPGSTITGETLTPSISKLFSEYFGGGGVFVNGGTFEMAGGTVSGRAENGGGVSMNGGRFTMNPGSTISGSSAASDGGGVFVSSGTFEMKGGTINDNTAAASGGGVYCGSVYIGTVTWPPESANVWYPTMSGSSVASVVGVQFVSSGIFEMTSGTINGNRAEGHGGGVSVYGGEFTMFDGTISGNHANGEGGGVYNEYLFPDEIGTFLMTSGTIYGANAADGIKNTAATNEHNGDAIDDWRAGESYPDTTTSYSSSEYSYEPNY
jgi:hypothetical protein